jgi:hypothetical protein
LPVRLVDSFMAPKDILQEFGDLAEEENVDSFTAPKDILQEFADLTEEEMTTHSFRKRSSPSP